MKTETLSRPNTGSVSNESRKKALNGVRAVVDHLAIRAFPNPDDPQPPGPWDPVIRRAFTRIRDRMGSLPQPWIAVALNPQPLPPQELFAATLAEEVVDQASRLQDLADMTGQSDEMASSYISRFADDIELCPPYRKWPFPPKKGGKTLLDPVDLVTLGVSLEHLAMTVPHDRLRHQIQEAGARLVERGSARM